MEDIFTQPKIVLMTIHGSLSKTINLEMLSTTISTEKCKSIGVIKFIGYNKIYFFNPKFTYHSDERKYFYNQCSFDFENKITVKLFSKGTFIVTGCLTQNDANDKIIKLLSIINCKKFIFLNANIANDKSIDNRLALVYDVSNCQIQHISPVLINYSIDLTKFEFNKYKVSNINNITDSNDEIQIESITDIFKYSSVSIKFKNIDGNIDFYKNKVIISIQNNSDINLLLNFFNKYKTQLVSIPMNKGLQKLIFLNSAYLFKNNNQSDINISKRIDSISKSILQNINKN